MDLPEARRHLNDYLTAPDPGTGFDDFLAKWEDEARIEDLNGELVTRRAQADSPVEEAEVMLVEALVSLAQNNDEWKRLAFSRLFQHPGMSLLLTREIEAGHSGFVPALVERIGEAFAIDGNADPPEDDPFTYRGEGYAALSAIADVPPALWALREALNDQEWAEAGLGDTFLRRAATYRSYTHDPERLVSFLQHSPIFAPLDAFDPIPLEIGTQGTLLEALVRQLQRSLADREWQRLSEVFEQHAPGVLGAEAIAAYRFDTEEIPGAVALVFQSKLEEIKKLDSRRQGDLADLAARMSFGRGQVSDDASQTDLSPFLDWLAQHGESPLDEGLAGSWLAAKTWDELPVAGGSNTVQKRVAEMLHPLRAIDPKVATNLVIHVTKLARENGSPKEYANRHSTLGEEILDDHLFEDRVGGGRAFIVNTFVAGQDELGIDFWVKFNEWQDYDLGVAMAQGGKTPDEKLTALFRQLNEFASVLEIDDYRILIGSAVNFAKRFPSRGITPEAYLQRIEAELARGPGESSKLHETLKVFADGARLAQRLKSGELPQASDPAEIPYREALTDSEHCWTWRFGVAATLLQDLESRASDEFVEAALDLLLEGYRDGRRFSKEYEGAVIRAMDFTHEAGKRDERRQQYLAAWKQRFLSGESSSHLYHVYGRTMRIALRQGDPKTAHQILETFSGAKNHPASFVSAILGGDYELALSLQQEYLEGLSYHPRVLDPGEDFEKVSTGYLEFLKAEGEKREGLLSHPPEALALHARAMFLSLDGLAGTPEWKKEARDVALALGAAYKESSVPPLAVNRALYLMSGLVTPPRELGFPLRNWFENYDALSFFKNGHRLTDIEFRPIQLHFQLALEDNDKEALPRIVSVMQSVAALKKLGVYRTFRDPFFDKILGVGIRTFSGEVTKSTDASKVSDLWFDYFLALSTLPRSSWEERARSRELEGLFAAAAVSDRGDELGPWWNQLSPGHQEFVEFLTSQKRNVLKDSARIAMRAKWISGSHKERKRVALALATAPGTRLSLPMIDSWESVKLGNPQELQDWGPALIAAAPREGFTALGLAALARKDRDLASAEFLFTLAETAAKDAGQEDAAFAMERAQITFAGGKTAEAVAILQAIGKENRLTPGQEEEKSRLLKAWTESDGKPQ